MTVSEFLDKLSINTTTSIVVHQFNSILNHYSILCDYVTVPHVYGSVVLCDIIKECDNDVSDYYVNDFVITVSITGETTIDLYI